MNPNPADAATDAEVAALIESLIAERQHPYVEGDGGEIAPVSCRDRAVRVALCGACSGSPFSSGILRASVERRLRYRVSEVVWVAPI